MWGLKKRVHRPQLDFQPQPSNLPPSNSLPFPNSLTHPPTHSRHELTNSPANPQNATAGIFPNATLRQTIYITQDAPVIRLAFSNAFGQTDLPITSASVALPVNNTAGSSAVQTATLQRVTFAGGKQHGFTIPPGALALSDPLNFTVRAQSVLAVTIYLAEGQAGFAVTGHPGSRTTSFAAPGEHVATSDLATVPGNGGTDHWYFLSAVDAWLPSSRSALAIVGDSITDGREFSLFFFSLPYPSPLPFFF